MSDRLFGRAGTTKLTDENAAPLFHRAARSFSSQVLWLGCLTIMFGICAIFAAELRSRYLSTITDAERVSQSFADVLAEHTARTFEAIERTLQTAASIRSELQSGRITAEKANEELMSLQKTAPALLAIGWTNEIGAVVAHSYKGKAVRPSIADLRHFTIQRDHADIGLFIARFFDRSRQTNGSVPCRSA